ncbi:MAG: VCBS repeat-containing protein, partial [Calditrichales bacterium]|nr:VCBS repeat-containing protein [Calditrichales bacterium]
MYNDKKFRLKIKSFRQLYLIFLIISFLLAVIIFYILDFSFYPYQLEILKKHPQRSNCFNLYHDFDKDGFSELISACSSKEEKEHSFFQLINYSGGIIDQFNFTEPISFRKIFMDDYNGDGYDEIFVFTGEEDSLFLSVIDAYRKKYILKRHFLLKTQKPFSHSKNNWHIYSAVFLDANDNNGKEIVFIAISGNSYQPRGIYSFNIEKQKITKKFETAAYVQQILSLDLTGDGNKEIILTSGAVGNIHYPAPYKDDRCWLFVLNRSFKPVFKPRHFGEYSSRLRVYPVDKGNEKFLILVYNYFGNKNLSNFFYLINSKSEIVKSKPFHRHNIYGRTGILADQISGSPGWFANISGNKLIRINDQLEFVLTESINYKNFWILSFKDFDADGQPELFCCNDENILIYNNQLKLAALHKIEKLITQFNQFSLKYNGPGKPIHICMDTQEYSYLIAFQKSPVYSYLPVVYILLTALIFLIITGCHILATRIYIYFNFFLHSLRMSSNGIIILNHKGNIIYLNSQVQPLLNLSNQILKKQHFTKALQEKPKIIEIIQKGIASGKPIKE